MFDVFETLLVDPLTGLLNPVPSPDLSALSQFAQSDGFSAGAYVAGWFA